MSGTMAATDAPTSDAHTERRAKSRTSTTPNSPVILSTRQIRVDSKLPLLAQRTRATRCYCLSAACRLPLLRGGELGERARMRSRHRRATDYVRSHRS